eukprot:TRINITY_DN587_c0_g1_i2.p1 TRINITY_DN587_c0_g1~~TRINITY_DN587_c0_g1_i2.p1  ORF type:complete len:127 (+),score=7.35 TRINITY_DN587_c0_g1_i2:206-586(+)
MSAFAKPLSSSAFPSSALTSKRGSFRAKMSSASASAKTVNVRIKGVVQGVFYRKWTEENAKELGIKGWVRNRRDGSVEALFAGDPHSVDNMIERCHRGPPAAVVTGLEVNPSEESPGHTFELKATC